MGAVIGKIKEETPEHTVLRKTEFYEVREYKPQTVAVFRGEKSDDTKKQPGSTGFFALAGYYGIMTSPKQDQPEPEAMAMTAPVLLTFDPENGEPSTAKNDRAEFHEKMETMSFVLSKKYKNIEDAPKPSDPRVKIEQIPAQTTAVLTFNGNLDYSSIKRNVGLLRDALAADNVTLLDNEPRIAGYNAPFVLPWYKTNEVQFVVDPASLPAVAAEADAAEADAAEADAAEAEPSS